MTYDRFPMDWQECPFLICSTIYTTESMIISGIFKMKYPDHPRSNYNFRVCMVVLVKERKTSDISFAVNGAAALPTIGLGRF